MTVSGAGTIRPISRFRTGETRLRSNRMRLENWPDSPAGQVYFAESAGTYGNFASTVLQITSYKSQSYSNGPFAQIGPLPAVKVMYIRIQRNPGAAVGNVPASSETVEAWDYQGTEVLREHGYIRGSVRHGARHLRRWSNPDQCGIFSGSTPRWSNELDRR